MKDGETVDDLFAFLTCPPSAEVGAVHTKAMPVILADPSEWETWLSAPFEIAASCKARCRLVLCGCCQSRSS